MKSLYSILFFALSLFNLVEVYSQSNRALKKPIKVSISSGFFDSENDINMSLLYNAYLDLYQAKNLYDPVTVKENDNISKIIKNNYAVYANYSDVSFNRTYRVIENAIAEQNEIRNLNAISPGDTLQMPWLPIRPFRNGEENTQVLAFNDDMVFFEISKDSVAINDKTIRPTFFENPNSRNSSTVETVFYDFNDLERFNKDMKNIDIYQLAEKIDIMEEVKNPEEMTVLDIILFGDENQLPNTEPIFNSLDFSFNTKEKVQSIENEYIREFIVMDFFNENNSNCNHGNSVLKVLNTIFTSLESTQFLDKIVKMPLDFYGDNRNTALKYIQKLYDFKGVETPKEIQKRTLALLKAVKRNGCVKNCVPQEFVYNLLRLSVLHRPDIINMSFAYLSQDSPFGNYYDQTGTDISFFAAVTNESGLVENQIDNIGVDGERYEPMGSIGNSNFLRTGSILVGGYNLNGELLSVHSRSGERIGSIGLGNWVGNESCSPGSSFASPQIAAYYWILKSYYRSIKYNVDKNEVMTRLLLCSNIEPAYIGKYASAGTPNLNKMLTGRRGFVTIDGKNFPLLKISNNSHIKVLTSDDKESILYLGRFKDPSTANFVGIQLKNNKNFIFKKKKWDEISNSNILSVDLNLSYDDNGNVKTLNIDSFEKFRDYKIEHLSNFIK